MSDSDFEDRKVPYSELIGEIKREKDQYLPTKVEQDMFPRFIFNGSDIECMMNLLEYKPGTLDKEHWMESFLSGRRATCIYNRGAFFFSYFKQDFYTRHPMVLMMENILRLEQMIEKNKTEQDIRLTRMEEILKDIYDRVVDE